MRRGLVGKIVTLAVVGRRFESFVWYNFLKV